MTPSDRASLLFPDCPEAELSPVPRRDQSAGTGLALKRLPVLFHHSPDGDQELTGLEDLGFPARRSFFQNMCQMPRLNVGEPARLRDRTGSRVVLKRRPEAARPGSRALPRNQTPTDLLVPNKKKGHRPEPAEKDWSGQSILPGINSTRLECVCSSNR